MGKVEIDSPKAITVTKAPQESDQLPDINDPIGLYFQDLSSYPVIDLEEENQLRGIIVSEIQARQTLDKEPDLDEGRKKDLESRVVAGKAARQALVEGNMRLVINIANEHRGKGVEFPDLIQEGNLGLIRAREKFDPTKYDSRFDTYAYGWIHRFIHNALESKRETGLRISRRDCFLYTRIIRIISENNWEFGDLSEAQITEIAQITGKSPERVLSLLQAIRPIRSLSEPIGEDGNRTLEEMTAGEDREFEEILIEQELKEKIEAGLLRLTPREEGVLKFRFGMRKNSQPQELPEIGRRYGLTGERIRQIEAIALKRLRHPRNSRHLKDFYK